MNRLFALLILFAALGAGLAAADLVAVCSTPDGCYDSSDPEGYSSQAACEEDQGTWFPPGTDSQSYCAEGCCQVDSDYYEDVTNHSCTEFQGGEWTAGECPVDTGATQCQEGETDCVCDGVEITTGTVCCGGEAIEADTCPEDTGGGQEETVVCGDGVLDDAETCDYSVDRNNPSKCDDIEGQYCTNACNCAYDDSDYEGFEDYCTPTDTDCTAEAECQPAAPGPTVSAVTGVKAADVDWTLNAGTCSGVLKGFEVSWQPGGGVSVASHVDEADVRSIRVEPLQAGVDYQFSVTAIYEVGGTETRETGVATPDSFSIGDESCFTGKTAYCTGEKTGAICGPDNKEDPLECTGDDVCVPYTDPSGQASVDCRPAVDCSECNRAYEIYGEESEDVEVEVRINQEDQNRTCGALAHLDEESNSGTRNFAYCYLDNTRQGGALKEYRSCAGVSSCVGYNSPDVCGDNPCKIQNGCSWDESTSICTGPEPDYPEHVDCDVPGIDEETCNELGACTYHDDECINIHEERSCELLQGIDACLGSGADFSLSDTFDVESRSNNSLGLTKCQFSESRGCFKNSDDNIDTTEGNDFTSPQTTITTDTTRKLAPKPEVSYVVSDDNPSVYTYLEVQDGSCADNERVAADKQAGQDLVDSERNVFILEDASEAGASYCLNYYSQDGDWNLEPVQQTEITILDNPLAFTEGPALDIQPDLEAKTATATLAFSLTHQATCELTRKSYNEQDPDAFTGTASAFAKIYKDLEEGVVPFEIDCTSPYGDQNWTHSQALDFDTRISHPKPAYRTTAYRGVTEIGIHAIPRAQTCEYRDGDEWKDLERASTTTTIDGREYYLHSTEVTHETGFYRYETRCTFDDGTVLEGSSVDSIAFAVDKQPPSTTLRRDGAAVQGAIEAPDTGASITITCQDPEIVGDGINRAHYHAGPAAIYNGNNELGTEEKPGGSIAKTHTVRPGDVLRIACEDRLGNREQARTYQVVSDDISGPERPEFEVTS